LGSDFLAVQELSSSQDFNGRARYGTTLWRVCVWEGGGRGGLGRGWVQVPALPYRSCKWRSCRPACRYAMGMSVYREHINDGQDLTKYLLINLFIITPNIHL